MPPTFAPFARRLEPADLAWATALLAEACAAHPVLAYCCTGADAATQRGWLLARLLRYGLRYGRVYANADRTALAVWLKPHHRGPTVWRLLQAGLLPAALWRLGYTGVRRLGHVLASATWLRRQTVASSGHYYLLALAVHPAQRGRGRGRRLLHATIAALHAAHTPCYFDTQVPEQLPFFQQLGFRLTGQCPAGPAAEAPTTWGLLREALP